MNNIDINGGFSFENLDLILVDEIYIQIASIITDLILDIEDEIKISIDYSDVIDVVLETSFDNDEKSPSTIVTDNNLDLMLVEENYIQLATSIIDIIIDKSINVNVSIDYSNIIDVVLDTSFVSYKKRPSIVITYENRIMTEDGLFIITEDDYYLVY